uniref:Putative transcription factor a mitochondrial n=1 Tax=Culex tarsalis TaxID=7177 RepID=A0A1Q3F5F9_CULTA
MQMNILSRLFSSTRLWTTNIRSTGLGAGLKTSAAGGEPAGTLPVKPKRPVNAYIRFLQSIRPELKTKNPKASPTEISKLAAVQWQVLDLANKTKLEEEYKKEQAIWLEQNAKYLSQLTDEQKEEIRQNRVEKSEVKAKREHRKRVKELGKPKRPLNGFLLYCQDQKPKNLNREENRSQIKSLSEQWSKLSEAQKEPYQRRAVDAVAKYREDMLKWEEKMIAQDNMDVVRRKNVLIPAPSKDVAPPTKSSKGTTRRQ